jgi:uncharacterized membrane protein required for colicin V production
MSIPGGLGVIVDIIAACILIFSFIGGLRDGAVREFLNLVALFLGLALAGVFVGYVDSWFVFVWDANWRSMFSFIVTFLLIMIVLGLLLWPLRALVEQGWNGGALWSILGGLFGVAGAAVGLVVLVTLFAVYPVFPWLNSIFDSSQVLNWLVSTLVPVMMLLPGPLRYI